MSTSSTKYARLTVTIELSRNSDYSSPDDKIEYVYETTVSKYAAHVERLATTAPGVRAYFLPSNSGHSDIVIFRNLDSTNYITASFYGPNVVLFPDSDLYVAPGQTVIVGGNGDIETGNGIHLLANAAACECTFSAFGAT